MKRLLILSGKGGTGKTTTAAAFVKLARARAFADCDVDAPNLHLVTQMPGQPEKSDFIGAQKAVIDPQKCVSCGLCREHCRFDAIFMESGKAAVQEYACEGCGVCQYLCPQDAVRMEEDVAGEQFLYKGDRVFSTAKLKMGRGNSGKLVTAVKVALFKNAPHTELAIIDGSPGIGCPVIASVSGVDLVLVVAEPSLSGISDLERLLKTAEAFDTRLAVCVNKWDVSPQNTEKIRKFCWAQKIPFVGEIPYDPEASKAINQGRTLADADCPAGKALEEIFSQVLKLIDLK